MDSKEVVGLVDGVDKVSVSVSEEDLDEVREVGNGLAGLMLKECS